MPLAGLEPARGEPLDFESSASANSATAAYTGFITEPEIIITPINSLCNINLQKHRETAVQPQ